MNLILLKYYDKQNNTWQNLYRMLYHHSTNISPRDLRPSRLILVSRGDTACDMDFAMYYSLWIVL